MSDPLRLRVLKALSTELEKIDNNGMKDRVFRGRSIYGDGEPLPMISILEPPIPLDAIRSTGDNAGQTGLWELLIQGWAKDDKANPTDPAHMLMAKVKQCLVTQKRLNEGFNILGLGDKVISLDIGQGSCRPADEVSIRAYFWLVVTLRIAEDLSDPFK